MEYHNINPNSKSQWIISDIDKITQHVQFLFEKRTMLSTRTCIAFTEHVEMQPTAFYLLEWLLTINIHYFCRKSCSNILLYLFPKNAENRKYEGDKEIQVSLLSLTIDKFWEIQVPQLIFITSHELFPCWLCHSLYSPNFLSININKPGQEDWWRLHLNILITVAFASPLWLSFLLHTDARQLEESNPCLLKSFLTGCLQMALKYRKDTGSLNNI